MTWRKDLHERPHAERGAPVGWCGFWSPALWKTPETWREEMHVIRPHRGNGLARSHLCFLQEVQLLEENVDFSYSQTILHRLGGAHAVLTTRSSAISRMKNSI
ncbi:hypothetical protein H4Q26_000782 [Puccinia striiformis f. sp. tritici PST-130]|nr:hypothetical protein H4Q26_000782 [Puccinia striiformis f. sp. tritici PST-130]